MIFRKGLFLALIVVLIYFLILNLWYCPNRTIIATTSSKSWRDNTKLVFINCSIGTLRIFGLITIAK
jgi:hypothetical protein